MKSWLTAREISDMALPGLPASKRNVNRLAKERGWRNRQHAEGTAPLARKRGGVKGGGGWEYHLSLVTEGLEPQRLVIAETSLDDAAKEFALKEISEGAQLVVLDPAEMAVLNRLAAQSGVPVGLLAQHWLKQFINMLQVAA